ncbi:aminopeptidase [Methylobacterium haplocladii]|uniref:Aminopeptidase n=1 Tax=Methylobacterium haplocladii TaxID=1176176 RepID=A0A512IL21_9HYPH|nr:aminopeptidase [Methylobacterium haplocladii]GEO98406.1 aminopeptidase [Methylobacterium haplocladii]GJD83034.1 Aminopeptidase T [Methylobacterium haplocladii]GLS59131.1 aminopeptidase [Methylobacterium haplocladii]
MTVAVRGAQDAALSFSERLDRLAEVAVKVGLGLRPGQELILTAPLESVGLARAITAQAYKAGASLVTTLYTDDVATLARFSHASSEAFDTAAGWLFNGMADAYRNGAARLAISGDDPSLLTGQDPDKVSRANRARSKAYLPALELIAGFSTNWTIVSAATLPWARTVFPDLPEDEALARLWDAVFSASRVDGLDAVAAWDAHNAHLRSRTEWLNGHRFAALRFRGPGTDLTVGLADDHEWCGGATTAKNGVVCNANIPTEEVFTTPHKARVEGHVTSTKPLSYQGTLIDGIRVTFREGRIVEASARTGNDVLARVLDTDEGAARLGEVALVPASSAISASGLLFYNTLYDENAASHIALGQAYSKCFRNGGEGLSEDDLAARGANRSLIHIDWMIGSAEIDVDGLAPDGRAVPVMRRGEWIS